MRIYIYHCIFVNVNKGEKHYRSKIGEAYIFWSFNSRYKSYVQTKIYVLYIKLFNNSYRSYTVAIMRGTLQIIVNFVQDCRIYQASRKKNYAIISVREQYSPFLLSCLKPIIDGLACREWWRSWWRGCVFADSWCESIYKAPIARRNCKRPSAYLFYWEKTNASRPIKLKRGTRILRQIINFVSTATLFIFAANRRNS